MLPLGEKGVIVSFILVPPLRILSVFLQLRSHYLSPQILSLFDLNFNHLILLSRLVRLRPVPLDMHPLYPPDLLSHQLLLFLVLIRHLALLGGVFHAVVEGVGPRDLRERHPGLLVVIGPRTKDPRLIH
jgi:hypothetical protein